VSKKKEKSEQKVSRKELRRQQVEREKRLRTLRLWGPIGLLLIVGIVFIVLRLMEADVVGAIFVDREPAGQHDAAVEIELGDLPPTGGIHSPTWQNCGIYTEPINAANAVHSLEHGAVWITYHPDLAPDQLISLQDLARDQGQLLLSPFPGQSSDIVLTAWDVQLELDSVQDVRIDEFINKYRNTRGPEPGASCSGGIGTPLN